MVISPNLTYLENGNKKMLQNMITRLQSTAADRKYEEVAKCLKCDHVTAGGEATIITTRLAGNFFLILL